MNDRIQMPSALPAEVAEVLSDIYDQADISGVQNERLIGQAVDLMRRPEWYLSWFEHEEMRHSLATICQSIDAADAQLAEFTQSSNARFDDLRDVLSACRKLEQMIYEEACLHTGAQP